MTLRAERFRLESAEQQGVRAEIRAILIRAARERRLLTYGEVCAQIQSVLLHPGSYVFARLLREVCFEAEAKGQGMLCALVVLKATGIPGGGYFRGAAAAGRVMDDLVASWRAEVEAVYSIWSEG